MNRLILASASPRRLDLLTQIKITPDQILPADIDETPLPGEPPKAYVKRMAVEKAQKIFNDHPNDIVLGADTSVVVGKQILGKARDAKEAATFLKKISGRRHHVMGGIAVCSKHSIQAKVITTIVKVKNLSEAEINAYLDSGEWQGKAGAYAIQGYAACFVSKIIGSYTNIVGLSLSETKAMLDHYGS